AIPNAIAAGMSMSSAGGRSIGSQSLADTQVDPIDTMATDQARTAQSNRQSRPISSGSTAASGSPATSTDDPTGPTSKRSRSASDQAGAASRPTTAVQLAPGSTNSNAQGRLSTTPMAI